MGFSRTYTQAIVFGPTTHVEIGSIDLRIEQGIMIVTEIMQTLRTPGYGQGPATYFPQDIPACIRIVTPAVRIPGTTSTPSRRSLLCVPTTVSSRTQDVTRM